MLQFLLQIFRNTLIRHGTLTLLALCLMLVYSVVGFMLTEGQTNPKLTWGDALWWAIVSMTTVGYGDLYPTTSLSRFLVGIPTMFFGCALVAQVLGSMADHIIKTESRKRRGLKTLRCKDHIIIIRLPSLTKVVQLVNEIRADESTGKTPIVLIDDRFEELPEDLSNLGVSFVRGNAEEPAVLNRANYENARQIIILADPDEPRLSDLRSLAIILSVEAKAGHVVTIAEVLQPEKVTVFKEAGCDSVLCVSDLSSQMIAQEIQDPGLGHVMQELTSNRSGKQLYMIPIPQQYKIYQDVEDWLKPKDALLIGLSHQREHGGHSHSSWYPKQDHPIIQGDRAIIIADERLRGQA
ncbi:potassium channel family protein [Pseudobacteriovorax antillogorgiicola]|uniref:Voltage-gated potassium channel n=2 Tax=Pseudobacteriovorax antillogorgiicola TaxID=1513793 RepID=A0A1Y6CX88_9BACT|nr:potassium channel family protein [Pseudobacteriovorax antillogorgiicola]TCS41259.1 voltage-gated potassium channel [Pseudobacteriovorax antillogorgiicola]SMF83737.1 voltage-gated potassium channel [Pseudobacteriovorax antillogorgiicola]